MRFSEEYPGFEDYSIPPYLLRLQDAKGLPNTSLKRTLLNNALKNHRAVPTTLLDTELNSPATQPESPDWIPYKSPYISEEEAGIRAAYENAKMESANRELLLIARENYYRSYEKVRDMQHGA